MLVLIEVEFEVLGTIQTDDSLQSVDGNLCQRNGLINPIPDIGQPYLEA